MAKLMALYNLCLLRIRAVVLGTSGSNHMIYNMIFGQTTHIYSCNPSIDVDSSWVPVKQVY